MWEREGNIDLIRRSLYGGKLDGRDFLTHLRTCMTFLGFKSWQADTEIWMREATKTDGTDYWKYVLLYVDDCLVVSYHVKNMLRE